MDNVSAEKDMRRMKLLFIGFAVLTPIGIAAVIVNSSSLISFVVLAVGLLFGLVCAFTPCPSCSKPTGVFFKNFVGGVFPLGFCFHCGKSYLSGRNSTNGSIQVGRAGHCTASRLVPSP